VTLVERNDFGSGLSFNHQRTLHGGLRAIETGRLRKARVQVEERRTWARIAPHLIRPLPFLVGTYRFSKRSRIALRAGFALYDAIGHARNTGIAPHLHLPAARLEPRATTERLFPGVRRRGLTGGAVWYDYQTHHPDRLLWTVALAARRAGAGLFNYVEAVAPLRHGGRVAGVRVRDRVTGREMDVLAAATLIAAGSGLKPLLDLFDTTGAPPLVRAMNLLVDRPAQPVAVAAPGRSGRMLTAVPFAGHVLVGTYQARRVTLQPESVASDEFIDDMLVDVNVAFPALDLTRHSVRNVQQGLTPATVKQGRADLMPESVVIDHAARGAPGLLSLVGVKFTTARASAEMAVNAVVRLLRKRVRPCETAAIALPHAGLANAQEELAHTADDLGRPIDAVVTAHLISWYGTEAPAVLRWSAERSLLDRVDSAQPVLAGEIAYAKAHADAIHVDDAVYRRTALGAAGSPGEPTLARARALMER
jgi:glycerol-3-phosphate dehydrogenase